jgi:hypothetical protein
VITGFKSQVSAEEKYSDGSLHQSSGTVICGNPLKVKEIKNL